MGARAVRELPRAAAHRAAQTRLRNVALGLKVLPSLLEPRRRAVWAEMRASVRGMPAAMAVPLKDYLAVQTPPAADLDLPVNNVRQMADAAAIFERSSPLGLCLRRSLLRYHFLRRAGLPLVINFGARFKGGAADRDVTGHAWVTLKGRPYYEDSENCDGFAVMLNYPVEHV